jgi:hypothetical protein
VARGDMKGLKGDPIEEFLIRVSWSCSPDHLIRRGEVMADVGVAPPNPPLTMAEMQEVAFATKMQVLRCLQARKGKKPSGKD